MMQVIGSESQGLSVLVKKKHTKLLMHVDQYLGWK